MKTELEQKLADARYMRDVVVTRPRSRDIIGFAYRVVAAQGVVDQAKKALYIYLRQNGSKIQHKDL
jgi:hypothetical protein